MPIDAKRVQSAFLVAIEVLDPGERAAVLDRLCGDDAEVRRRVETLLKANDQPESLPHGLNESIAATINQPAMQRSGAVIAGRYKLLEQIGEGGMGTVWVAEQTEPVKRRVALKLIKPGMDTRQVLSRFEAERQALALMDHPNIARVFDGGMTDEGRPFFVMEYVKGLPLTQYCNDAQLTVADRLALFTQVCQAVQHAHQKGIIHRDLKPSNILVCLYDGQPVPKVIDFGLAKAMHQPLTEHTLYTAHGLMMGTPLYMSPEQAEFNNLDIDTRSDIYSLGVILYELLTGTTPLEKRQFKDAAWQEMVRLIKQEEPPRPSIRLSGSGSLPMLAAQRQLEPAKLTKTVRGELDWIVMKALEKDRSRRYETANGLARDVQRYLADEAVEACPPSASYRLRKFARRNMRALTTAALVGVMLLVIVGAVAGSLGWTARDRQARQAKLAGQLELILDEVQQQEAAQKWPEALAAARRAEALLAGGGGDAHLVRQVNEVLADLKLVERLEAIRMEQSGHQEEGGFEWVERAYAAAFREFGVDLDGMTADEAARRLRLRPAVAPVVGAILDEWTAWRCLSGKAEGGRALSAVAGRLDDDPWRQQVRGVVAQIDTNIFADEGHGLGNMDPKAVAALERLVASPNLVRQPPATLYHLGMMLTLGGAKPEVGATMLRKAHAQYPGDFWINNALALSLEMMGAAYFDESLGYYRAALALRPDVGWTWYKIGAIQQIHHKKLDEANACYRKALELSPLNAAIHNNVGRRLQAQQKLVEAVACYHKAMELNPNFTAPHSNLGGLLTAEKRFDEAAAAYRKAIEIDPKSESGHYGLGMALLEQNRVEEAVATLTRAIELSPKGASLRWALGRALHKQKKLDDAVACFHKAVELNPKLAMGYWGLGFVLLDQKKAGEAVGSFQMSVALDPKHAYAQYGLGLALMETKQTDDAIIAFRKAVELDPIQRVDAQINLGILLAEQGQVDEAITSFRKAIERSPQSVLAHNRLGIALADHGQVAEGIACFRKAVELNPNTSWAHINLAWYLATAADPKLRDPQAAVVHAQRALDLDDNAPKHWNKLGVALWRAGNAKAAVETLEMADQKWDGKIHQYRFFLAMAYWQLGEKDKARLAYGQAAEWMDQNQPDNKEQRRFRAEAAELLGIAQPVVTTPQ